MALVVGTNSYVSRADATTYFADSLRSASWVALADTTKDQALVTATRMLDRQLWAGTKTSDSQELEWPRTGVTDAYGNVVDPDTVPQSIIDACCELALSLALNPSGETNANAGSNIKRVSAAKGTDIEFFRPTTAGRFPTIVQELIRGFLGGTSSVASIGGEVSGNCGVSQFTCNPYGLNNA